MIERVALFRGAKERLIAVLVLFAFGFTTLGYHYYLYYRLTTQKFYYTTAIVLNQYQKGDRQILKFKTPYFTFYTSTREQLRDLRDRAVKVMLIKTKRNPSFWKFLKGFYSVSYITAVLPKSRRYELKERIAAQHKDPFAKELFSALFLATSISKALRDKLSALGLAHLVALSGFHLGVILAIVSGVLGFLFRPLWSRLFPYRNLYFFSALTGLGVAGVYTVFVGFVPSLVRAFVLNVAVFIFFWRYVKFLSFELLVWIVGFILAIEPQFLFNIGFWFSAAGVFCIYLFFHHCKHFSKRIQLLFFNFWVYVLMLPIIHTIFPMFSWWQLLSPLISFLFVLFYPLALFLHLVGLGGWLDGIVGLLHHDLEVMKLHTPLWFLFLFGALLLASIYKHRFIFFAFFLEICWFVYEVT